MAQLFIKKGDYQVTPNDILDTLNGGTSSGGNLFVNGFITWKSGLAFSGTLQHNNTANQIYTFPNASGVVALLSNTQIWSGQQLFNTNNLLAVDVTARTNTLQLRNIGLGLGSTIFVKMTLGNDGFGDLLTVGGTQGSNRQLVFQLPDSGSQWVIRDPVGTTYATFSIQNSQFFPIDNTISLGKTGGRWTAVWAVNGTIQTSFSKFKKDIVGLEPSGCLAICKKIDSIFFKWKDDTDDKIHFGINADPLLKELPSAVSGEDGVFDRSLIALVFGAVRDLDARLAKLENNS